MISAISFASIMVISEHYWGYKSMPPQSWEEILDSMWVVLIFSIIYGIGMLCIVDKYLKKRKEEEEELNRK